mmetsp:Transcript_21902/g.37859  ORF Transcript_21902/g.37859 Transcript_21902/m.37859 type:complete len:232 (+) Transcript_21902:2909-3604(+)
MRRDTVVLAGLPCHGQLVSHVAVALVELVLAGQRRQHLAHEARDVAALHAVEVDFGVRHAQRGLLDGNCLKRLAHTAQRVQLLVLRVAQAVLVQLQFGVEVHREIAQLHSEVECRGSLHKRSGELVRAGLDRLRVEVYQQLERVAQGTAHKGTVTQGNQVLQLVRRNGVLNGGHYGGEHTQRVKAVESTQTHIELGGVEGQLAGAVGGAGHHLVHSLVAQQIIDDIIHCAD